MLFAVRHLKFLPNLQQSSQVSDRHTTCDCCNGMEIGKKLNSTQLVICAELKQVSKCIYDKTFLEHTTETSSIFMLKNVLIV